MTKTEMNTLYCHVRQYGKIIHDDNYPNIVARFMIIVAFDMTYHVSMKNGEVFVITEVRE
jgi:hypothetical protein